MVSIKINDPKVPGSILGCGKYFYFFSLFSFSFPLRFPFPFCFSFHFIVSCSVHGGYMEGSGRYVCGPSPLFLCFAAGVPLFRLCLSAGVPVKYATFSDSRSEGRYNQTGRRYEGRYCRIQMAHPERRQIRRQIRQIPRLPVPGP